MRRHRLPALESRIEPNSVAFGRAPINDRTRGGNEPLVRIFCIDPNFNRMTC